MSIIAHAIGGGFLGWCIWWLFYGRWNLTSEYVPDPEPERRNRDG